MPSPESSSRNRPWAVDCWGRGEVVLYCDLRVSTPGIPRSRSSSGARAGRVTCGPRFEIKTEMPPRSADLELGLLGNQVNPAAASPAGDLEQLRCQASFALEQYGAEDPRYTQSVNRLRAVMGQGRSEGMRLSPSRDPSGEGQLGEPRFVTNALQAAQQATLEDRGVRGVFLRCDTIELPLALANIQRDGATVTVTVHEGMHPGCEHKGAPIPLACASVEDADNWQREMQEANEKVERKPWGVSKSFILEQQSHWKAEGKRSKGMTVYQYFEDLGLGDVYDATWSWCAGVLARLETQGDEKTIKTMKQQNYYRRKVEKTELYEDMELTDYMNVLKHQELVPAGKKVSYASFIADESDNFGRRKVGSATVFVSHVWNMKAKDFFEVCLAEMAEEDFAWIDLYLHNQYQLRTEEENSGWIDKFGSLIAEIGKVIAIVTDWESPAMLTRIWCLFELNAAIDAGAELKLVATAAQKQELVVNLMDKFKLLEMAVTSIEVRDCDANQIHEIQDKQAFLDHLRGMEDEVNEKLRQRMRLWLCEAAEGAIQRTDPHRPRLDEVQMALEAKEIGEGSWCGAGCGRGHGCVSCVCFPLPSNAKLTRLAERMPRLGPILSLLAVIMWAVVFTIMLFLGFMVYNGDGKGHVSFAHGGKVASTWQKIVDRMPEDQAEQAADAAREQQWRKTELILSVVLGLSVCGASTCTACALYITKHQNRRQLRQPALLGDWATRHCGYVGFVVGVLATGLGTLFLGIVGMFLGVLLGFVVTSYLSGNKTAEARASLRVLIGWLQLRSGDAEGAAANLGEAHADLQKAIGTECLTSWAVAAPYARALCDEGRIQEALAVRHQLDAAVARGETSEPPMFLSCIFTLGCKSDQVEIWRKSVRAPWIAHGPLLRAGIAVAVRAPDAEVLTLLEAAARADYSIPAGSKSSLEGPLPEWAEFLDWMASSHEGPSEGVQVVVPPGARAGDLIPVCAPTVACWMQVQVPSGVTAGQAFQVQLTPNQHQSVEDRRRWRAYRDKTVGLVRAWCDEICNDGKVDSKLKARGLPEEVVKGEDDEAKKDRLLASLLGHPAYGIYRDDSPQQPVHGSRGGFHFSPATRTTRTSARDGQTSRLAQSNEGTPQPGSRPTLAVDAKAEAANARAEARHARAMSAQINRTVVADVTTEDELNTAESVSTESQLEQQPHHLAFALEAAKLSQYEDALRELGCVEAADLAEVQEEELLELGMKRIEAKRLLRLATPHNA